MARAYSYDLRQKVIKAIELDGWKKSEAAEIFQISRNTLVETQLICGSNEEKKQGIIIRAQIVLTEQKPKLLTGKHLRNLLTSMVLELKLKWLSCGKNLLALEQFRS